MCGRLRGVGLAGFVNNAGVGGGALDGRDTTPSAILSARPHATLWTMHAALGTPSDACAVCSARMAMHHHCAALYMMCHTCALCLCRRCVQCTQAGDAHLCPLVCVVIIPSQLGTMFAIYIYGWVIANVVDDAK